MHLFSADYAPSEEQHGWRPVIATPMGTVTLSCAARAGRLTDRQPDRCYELRNDARVLAWQQSQCRLELLLTPMAPQLPEGMSVLGCVGALWRVTAPMDWGTVTFQADWEPGYTWTSCAPDGGENLVAQEYDDGRHVAHVATAESEYTGRRNDLQGEWPAGGEQWQDVVPAEWASALELASVNYTPHGLAVALPARRSSGPLEVHFTVAWQQQGDDDESSWFAADVLPTQVLAAAGCR